MTGFDGIMPSRAQVIGGAGSEFSRRPLNVGPRGKDAAQRDPSQDILKTLMDIESHSVGMKRQTLQAQQDEAKLAKANADAEIAKMQARQLTGGVDPTALDTIEATQAELVGPPVAPIQQTPSNQIARLLGESGVGPQDLVDTRVNEQLTQDFLGAIENRDARSFAASPLGLPGAVAAAGLNVLSSPLKLLGLEGDLGTALLGGNVGEQKVDKALRRLRESNPVFASQVQLALGEASHRRGLANLAISGVRAATTEGNVNDRDGFFVSEFSNAIADSIPSVANDVGRDASFFFGSPEQPGHQAWQLWTQAHDPNASDTMKGEADKKFDALVDSFFLNEAQSESFTLESFNLAVTELNAALNASFREDVINTGSRDERQAFALKNRTVRAVNDELEAFRAEFEKRFKKQKKTFSKRALTKINERIDNEVPLLDFGAVKKLGTLAFDPARLDAIRRAQELSDIPAQR